MCQEDWLSPVPIRSGLERLEQYNLSRGRDRAAGSTCGEPQLPAARRRARLTQVFARQIS
jgi:hypothetical protein